VNIHKNARTTPHSRAEIARPVVRDGQTPAAVAAVFGVCLKTVLKWAGRFRDGGLEALADRSSRRRPLHRPTPQNVRQDVIELRHMRRPGCEIARQTCLSASTVSRILRAARRYAHAAPGDMIHLDIRKLGRFDRVGRRITGDRKGPVQSPQQGQGMRLAIRPRLRR
jgi:transposase-like protein